MLFTDIPGLGALKSRVLQTITSGHLAHALLLTGHEMSAALPMALAMARYLHCENPGKEDACGICPSCIKMDGLVHPDVHFTFPVAGSGQAKDQHCEKFLDPWRETLQQFPFLSLEKWHQALGLQNQQTTIYTAESDRLVRLTGMKPYEGKLKVFLIWLPEKMQPEAANKLLKSIEEPPAETYFFLISYEPEKILPTIYSRCQVMTIPRVIPEELEAFLIQKHGLEPDRARTVAQISEGLPGKALEEIRSEDSAAGYFEDFVSWMRLCYSLNIQELSEWIDNLSSTGREHIKGFLVYTLGMIRENLLYSFTAVTHRMTPAEMAFGKKFSEYIHEKNISAIHTCLNHCHADIERNGNARIVLMDTSLQMHKLIKH